MDCVACVEAWRSDALALYAPDTVQFALGVDDFYGEAAASPKQVQDEAEPDIHTLLCTAHSCADSMRCSVL